MAQDLSSQRPSDSYDQRKDQDPGWFDHGSMDEADLPTSPSKPAKPASKPAKPAASSQPGSKPQVASQPTCMPDTADLQTLQSRVAHRCGSELHGRSTLARPSLPSLLPNRVIQPWPESQVAFWSNCMQALYMPAVQVDCSPAVDMPHSPIPS